MRRSKYIDNIQLQEIDGKLHMYITGWFTIGDMMEQTFSLYADGKKIETEIERQDRYDIARNQGLGSGKKIGFTMKCDIDHYSSIKTYEVFGEVNGHKEELMMMSGKNVKSIIKDTLIQMSIDRYAKGSKNELIVTGWAVSHDGDIQFQVVNKKNEPLDYSITYSNRMDLYTKGFVENDKEKTGFEIKIKAAYEDVVIILSTKHFKRTEGVGEFLRKQAAAHRKEHMRSLLRVLTPRKIARLIGVLFKYGASELREEAYRMIMDRVESQAVLYEEWFAQNKASKEKLSSQAVRKFEYEPLVSVVVPTYNTPIEYLKEMIDSVIAQSYGNWQLCIADGSGNNKKIQEVLEAYHNKDSRVKYEILEKNLGIAGNSNAALALADGDIIGLLDHDDTLEPDALYEVVQCFQDKEVDSLYTDEDKILGPKWINVDPHFKSDFNLDLLRSHNYITHFFCVKKSIMDQVGGFKEKYDGAQDYDLILRCYELSRKMAHIPRILYHWRMHSNSTAANPESKLYCQEAGQRAVEDHLKRVGVQAEVTKGREYFTHRVKYAIQGSPLISIIIPNKDHTDDLKVCIDSVMEKSTYRNIEIIVVENNSTEQETFDYYEKLEKQYENVKVLKWEREFNYSAINNFGVRNSKGEYVLLLNNDTEIIRPDSIEDMLGICMRKEVGIVGARLLYNDDTVQHAGVAIGLGGAAGHVGIGLSKDDPGYFTRMFLTCDYSAVTAACLMVRRDVFEEVDGLCEEYAVAFNDVDFCLKVRHQGYLVVYDAYSEWYHYESKSRGLEDTEEKIKRFNSEVDRLNNRWEDEYKSGDPFYNKNFSLTNDAFCIDRNW